MSHVLRLVAAALAVAAATGCTPDRKEPQEVVEPPLGEIVTVTSRSQVIPAPLLEYKTSVEEQFAIQRAVAKLSVGCMARFGVIYTPPQSRREDISAARAGTADRYGPVSLDEAMASAGPPAPGSSKDEGKGPSVPTDPREAELMSGQDRNGQPSKLRDKAGNPVPQYGCGRESFDKLGYRPNDILLVDGLLNDSWTLMGRDPRYLNIQAKWSECMKKRGFDLKSRGEPSKTAAEIQRRTKSDVECAQNINYVGVVNAIDIAHQKRLMVQNSATLSGIRENNKSMAAKAQEYLRG